MAEPRAGEKPERRRPSSELRRRAILEAALALFAEHGFESTRLDDVAARAGVAKGTLYLYFDHKEALFEALIRDAVVPVIEQLQGIAESEAVPALLAIERMFEVFQTQVLDTDRKLILRLVITEGSRFPGIARFYHREVVARGLAVVRRLSERANREGRFIGEGVVRFPQLIVAPLLLAVIWDGLFDRIERLDVRGMLAAHLELMSGRPRRGAP